jgi:Glu-tRNA(Gln) amidotransferase subunit E-like FAD-binding protein
MKKEADKLGIPLRELLTRSMKKDKPAPKKAAAKKGGMMKKKSMARGGVSKRRTRK